MTSLAIRAALIAVLTGVASACVTATPELVLREEAEADPTALHLCRRMSEDFDMRPSPVEGSAPVRLKHQANFADRLISGRGLSFGFTLTDEHTADLCVNVSNGVTCEVDGPATLEVRTAAGKATYHVNAGARARVASAGSLLTCEELS